MHKNFDIVNKNIELDNEFYKTLLESTNAIPWQIDWKAQRFTYIGPQIQELLGWSHWDNVSDWADRMHPEDREWAVNYCVTLSRDGIDHEADYRALTADGRYIWVRDVVHVIRCNGETKFLVGFMFDISERKKNEEELIRLQKELETLSYQDSLTEIANRRSYDLFLRREWDIAVHFKTVISIVLIDIDFFKKFNDTYGHSAGDTALKTVAQILKSEVRTQDIAARLGGEEFIIILPMTDHQEAMLIAERIRCRIEATSIQLNNYIASLTASFGVGSTIPMEGDNPESLMVTIDQRLYCAKEEGRNKVVGF